MDIENGVDNFILKKPIMVKFEGEGSSREVVALELREPTRKHLKRASRLKQMVMGAMMEASERQGESKGAQPPDESKPIEEKTPEEISEETEALRKGVNIALVSSQTIDLGDFVELFIEMAVRKDVPPIVLCDGEMPIKPTHFDDMKNEDIERLAITYASFFCMPSVLQEM